MRLQVKGRNLEVSEQIRTYAEEKLGKLDRLVSDPTRVELELAVEKNPSIAANHVAEATVWTKGPVLRARETSPDMRASIDRLADKLEPEVAGPLIVKTKQFAVKPMGAEEAVLQLELVGHDFFVFRDADSGDVNVV